MTDSSIRDALIARFETLNAFSGIAFTNSGNVSKPNRSFTPPSDGRWFALSYMPDKPAAIALGVDNLDRWSGVFQIDIHAPLDSGEDETDAKYSWLSRLFARGSEFGGVCVSSVYSPKEYTEENSYVKVVRIEWTADIDNEET